MPSVVAYVDPASVGVSRRPIRMTLGRLLSICAFGNVFLNSVAMGNNQTSVV